MTGETKLIAIGVRVQTGMMGNGQPLYREEWQTAVAVTLYIGDFIVSAEDGQLVVRRRNFSDRPLLVMPL